MSRVLEPEVAAQARAQSNDECYTQLLQGLKIGLSSTPLLEIEFLGKEFVLPEDTYFLVEDDSIAVPKKSLVLAFLSARRMFFDHDQTSSLHVDVVMDTSTLMLLMDPEHLTAANARKRVLLESIKKDVSDSKARLEFELQFLDSLLTSPLHRHTKSPNLWSHRKWLVELCLSNPALSRTVTLEHELLDVVMKSAERHPRNYYSWSYIRWLLLKEQRPSEAPHHLPPSFEMDQKVCEWCLKHPNDISGWSFLLFILTNPSVISSLSISVEQASMRASLMGKEVLRYTIRFGWKNESVWVFLRTLFATQYIDHEARSAFLAAVAAISQGCDSVKQKQMRAVVAWCSDNQQNS